MARAAKRSVQAVIDAALAEGRRWEWLCYALVAFFVLLGSVVLIVGIVRESGLTALAGSVFTGLFWPALRYADSVRRDLVRTRLYEIALAKAKTAGWRHYPVWRSWHRTLFTMLGRCSGSI